MVQTDQSLSGTALFSLFDGAGDFVNEVGAQNTPALSSFSVFAENHPGIKTGIALANPNGIPAQVALTLRDAGRNQLGDPMSLPSIPANGHTSKYLTEIFPQGTLPEDLQGKVESGADCRLDLEAKGSRFHLTASDTLINRRDDGVLRLPFRKEM